MSNPSLKRFRVVVIEWLSHDAVIEAPDALTAEAEHARYDLHFSLVVSLPSPSGRASAASGSSRSLVSSASGPTLKRTAGGKHSRCGSPGSPSTMTGITRAARPRALKRLIS